MNSNRFYPALVAVLALLAGMVIASKIIMRWPGPTLRNRLSIKRAKVIDVVSRFIDDVASQAPESEAMISAANAARHNVLTFSLTDASEDQALVDSLVHLTQVYASYQQLQGQEAPVA